MKYGTKLAIRDFIIFITVVLLSVRFAFAQDSIYVKKPIWVHANYTPDTVRFSIKYKNRLWIAYKVEYNESTKVAEITLFKPLRCTRYRYAKLKRLGYECKPYKGSVFLTYKRYLDLVNNKNITK